MKHIKNGEYEYNKSDILAKTAIGQIFKGRHFKTDTLVAIKVISIEFIKKAEPRILTAIKSEISSQEKAKNLESPYILTILDSFETRSNIYIITEFCESDSLIDLIFKNEDQQKSFSSEISIQILHDLMKALSTLDDLCFVHRNIRPESIFIKNGVCKLGEFGYAKQIMYEFQTKVGGLTYMAPEFFTSHEMTAKVDIWAFGVIACKIVLGYFPYGKKPRHPLQNDFVIDNKHSLNIEQTLLDLIVECLVIDPEKRLDIVGQKNHKVFKILRFKRKKTLTGDDEEKPIVVKANSNTHNVESNSQNHNTQKNHKIDILTHGNNYEPQKQGKTPDTLIAMIIPEKRPHVIRQAVNKLIMQFSGHRNITMLTFNTTLYFLKNMKDLAFTIFVQAKYCMQRHATTKLLLDNRYMPQIKDIAGMYAPILVECTDEEWCIFITSNEFSNFHDIVCDDISRISLLYGNAYNLCKKKFPTPSPLMKKIVQKNLNNQIKPYLSKSIYNCVHNIINKYMYSPEASIHMILSYLCIIERFVSMDFDSAKAYRQSELLAYVQSFSWQERKEYLTNFLKAKVECGLHRDFIADSRKRIWSIHVESYQVDKEKEEEEKEEQEKEQEKIVKKFTFKNRNLGVNKNYPISETHCYNLENAPNIPKVPNKQPLLACEPGQVKTYVRNITKIPTQLERPSVNLRNNRKFPIQHEKPSINLRDFSPSTGYKEAVKINKADEECITKPSS